MNHIPVHLLNERTNNGLQIKYFKKDEIATDDAASYGAHRDDHYIFFLLEQGEGSLMIDFQEVDLSGTIIYYVLPSQVHHRIKNENTSGWFIAVDTSLVPQECRNIFEGGLLLQQPYALNAVALNQYQNLLTLLQVKHNEEEDTAFYSTIVHPLLQSFIGMVASCYNKSVNFRQKVSRAAQLTSQFKNLLNQELKTNKRPADYASRLNISESYLSEMIKKHTGFSASYWIQQEVMMEAKRLLYYSQLSVKEIAHSLGYDDHSYFSRLFRKTTGVSAITFRTKYRK